MTDISGQYLGRYYLTERLGEGGMAVVYKAYDTRLERDVAVKIIRSGAFPSDELDQILKRFEREAKSLAKLSHHSIVKVHDYGEHGGSPYLVMEYLPGGTLKMMLGMPIPWQDAVRLILPVARGVAYAHRRGILHRDIKPANVLIADDGEPMLSDFGIAKLFEGDQTTALTGSGMAIGTPEYMAPEQWTGTTSPLSDLYSLGIVLYEMVAGRKPYMADTPAAILIKQATEPLPSPRKFAVDLPEALELVLIKALAKEPEDRYKDLNAFIAALENLHVSVPVVVPAPEPKRVEETYRIPSPKPDTTPPTEVVTKVGSEPFAVKAVEPQKVEEPLPAKMRVVKTRPPIKFSRKVVGILIGAIVFVLAVWLGSPLIGKLFVPAPVATESFTPVALNTASQAVEPTQTGQPPALAVTSDNTGNPTLTPLPTIAPGTVQGSPIDGMLLHYIPAGTFIMGDTAEHASAECLKTMSTLDNCTNWDFTNEEPKHNVYLDAYWMDETEITNEKYKSCVKAGACKEPSTLSPFYSDDRHGDYPVVFVSWIDANAYCSWAGRRLPTEAEWEKAARGTDGRTYPWGEATGTDYANYNSSPGDVTRVGSYKLGESPYGLYDMAGNVWEMVADWYQDDYYKTLGNNAINPQGPASGQGHVKKGGGFLYNQIQSAFRDNGGVTGATNETGFRCALSANTTSSQSTVTQTPPPGPAANDLPTQITDDKGVEMILVPAGEFTMGSNAGDPDEQPVHQVYLDAYYMDKYEVTNELYRACVKTLVCQRPSMTISHFHDDYYLGGQFNDYPVVYIDWDKANTYCQWRDARLPTEAEWEKAARGTDGRTYPWGEGMDTSFANYNNFKGVNETTRVGSYLKGISIYGIYDLAGNVSEWVSDWYSETYYQSSPNTNPTGPASGSYHVKKGGDWRDGLIMQLRTSDRDWADASNEAIQDVGFRCAKSAP